EEEAKQSPSLAKELNPQKSDSLEQVDSPDPELNSEESQTSVKPDAEEKKIDQDPSLALLK
ncbi:MAG: hypothetical protein AAF558_15525, partial [Verrucomicrobiota bacterium]